MLTVASAPESYIESLELFGMQFGLERIHDLLDRLGNPEAEFDAIHVVGSNGKSSTVRFCEALLEARGRAHRRVHLAAHHHLPRADPGGRRDAVRGGLRRRRAGCRDAVGKKASRSSRR